MREESTRLVYELSKKDKRIMALTADGRNGFWEQIKKELPNQYVDFGIAEQNMVACAAGMASCGKIPFIFGTSTFLAMRAFEFIRNDVCIPNMNVKFLGIFSGLSRPAWGATHQGTEGLALLRCLPNMQVITPSTPIMAREATRWAYEHKGPVYIRLEASGETEYYDDKYSFTPGKANELLKHKGQIRVVLITIGSVVDFAFELSKKLWDIGVICQIVDMPTVKPVDSDILHKYINEKSAIVTIEEHSRYGGLGSAVAEVIAEYGKGVSFHRVGLEGCALGCGGRENVRKANGINRDGVVQTILNLING